MEGVGIMLELRIPAREAFDDATQTFINTKPATIRLEHSLVAVAKWETRWKKPFLSRSEKTIEETLDYIRCMTISQNIDPNIYYVLTNAEISEINKYIDDEKTATTFSNYSPKNSRQVVTSELIYYWMAAYGLPIEAQKWHLSRLLTLIRIASIENSPKKKMSKRAIMSQNKSLNAARRKALGSKG